MPGPAVAALVLGLFSGCVRQGGWWECRKPEKRRGRESPLRGEAGFNIEKKMSPACYELYEKGS